MTWSAGLSSLTRGHRHLVARCRASAAVPVTTCLTAPPARRVRRVLRTTPGGMRPSAAGPGPGSGSRAGGRGALGVVALVADGAAFQALGGDGGGDPGDGVLDGHQRPSPPGPGDVAEQAVLDERGKRSGFLLHSSRQHGRDRDGIDDAMVLRGNSASGKSTMASALRNRYGRGIAIVAQDNLRRIVLRERDVPGGAYIGLVDTVARYALDNGHHTIIEGIFHAAHCAGMLTALREDHRGRSHFCYLDVPFEETIRPHATKPQASQYGRAEMSAWYRSSDLLPDSIEHVIPASSTLDATVGRILRDTRLPAPGAVPTPPPPA